MPRCDFNKVLCNFIEIALRHGCSPVNLLHIFRTPLPKNTAATVPVVIVSCSNASDEKFEANLQ